MFQGPSAVPVLCDWQAGLEAGCHELVHDLAGDSGILQVLGAWVDAGEVSRTLAHGLLDAVDLRMDEIETSVVGLRLAEENPFGARLETLIHPLHALEEHDLDGAASVAHEHAEALSCEARLAVHGLRPLALELYAVDGRAKLDRSRIGGDVRYPRDAAPVDVAERVQTDQVAEGLNLQLLQQKLRSLGPNARQILQIGVQFAVSDHILQRYSKVPKNQLYL